VSSMPQQSQDISIPDLRSDLNGEVIGPDDAGYEEARQVVFKGVDRQPAGVVRVAGATPTACADYSGGRLRGLRRRSLG